MDLGAYVQIDEFDDIMKRNGIEVPRLRGLRRMKDEEPIDMEEKYQWIAVNCLENLCESIPSWTPYPYTLLWNTYNHKKFLYYTYGKGRSINWGYIHGKKRKVLKTYIRNEKKRYERQYLIFNKYCGRDDVLYIHARIGGGNWAYFGGAEISRQPWFIEKVDDAFDCTYCDIYARIK